MRTSARWPWRRSWPSWRRGRGSIAVGDQDGVESRVGVQVITVLETYYGPNCPRCRRVQQTPGACPTGRALRPIGRTLGCFVPLIDMSQWEPVTPEVSEEELDCREKSKEKCHTTAEVLAYLEKL